MLFEADAGDTIAAREWEPGPRRGLSRGVRWVLTHISTICPSDCSREYPTGRLLKKSFVAVKGITCEDRDTPVHVRHSLLLDRFRFKRLRTDG